MKDIISRNIPINKIKVKREKAIEIFKSYGMEDKVLLLEQVNFEYVSLYELDGRYDYFYGYMAQSTGVIRCFDVMYYEPGFILRYPPEKVDITGIIYEPWHYRYVGKTAAEEIMKKNLTLEEYLLQ